MENIEWEQVESPEYIAYCEENNFGYTEGVSKCGNWTRQKVWQSDDKTDKRFRTHIWSTFNPFDEERQAPEPYRITSVNGTYIDPITRRRNFLNSLPQAIFMPLGLSTEVPPVKFGVNYNPKDDEKD